MLLEGISRNINGRRQSRSALIFVSARQYALVSNTLPVRKNYFDSNIVQNANKGYCDVFRRIILKRTSTEARVFIRRPDGAKFDQVDVRNEIYHKFLYGAVSYMLNG